MNKLIEIVPDASKARVMTSELAEGFSMFGNKGAVWSNQAHIAQADFSGRTLCGIPMLSHNHARIEGVKEIGCEKCIAIYRGIQLMNEKAI